jgi:hypothetical protein
MMRVYVHGNCQASALRWLLSAVEGLHVESREVHLIDILDDKAIEEYKRDIRSHDVILAQPIADNYHQIECLSLSWIQRNIKSSARLLTFPSIFFRGYNPSSFALEMKGHITDYHDVHMADMYLLGVSAKSCVEWLRSDTFWSAEFVNSEVLLALKSLMKREEGFDVHLRCSGLIAQHLGNDRLFFTFNHPSRFVLHHLGSKFLNSLGVLSSLPVRGVEYLDQTCMPLYPSLIGALGLPRSGDEQVRLPNMILSWEDFAEQVYSSYDRLGGKQAVAHRLSTNEGARRYLDRFRRAHAVTFGALVNSLYSELLGRPPNDTERRYWAAFIESRGITAAVDEIRASEEATHRVRHDRKPSA